MVVSVSASCLVRGHVKLTISLDADVHDVLRGMRDRVGAELDIRAVAAVSSAIRGRVQVRGKSYFFMTMNRKALPSVWPSLMNSNEAAESVDPGSCVHKSAKRLRPVRQGVPGPYNLHSLLGAVVTLSLLGVLLVLLLVLAFALLTVLGLVRRRRLILHLHVRGVFVDGVCPAGHVREYWYVSRDVCGEAEYEWCHGLWCFVTFLIYAGGSRISKFFAMSSGSQSGNWQWWG